MSGVLMWAVEHQGVFYGTAAILWGLFGGRLYRDTARHRDTAAVECAGVS